MLRRREDLVRVCDLDELAAVHHGDAVAHMPHGGEVVRDEEVREPETALKIHQEVEDLRPDRDVERRHRLVADDQRGVGRKGAGDRHALALPTGELERPPLAEVGTETHELEQLGDAATVPPLLTAAQQHQGLGDDLLDRHQGVERVTGVLEHHLDPAPLLDRETCSSGFETTSSEDDLSPCPLRESEEEASDGRLPRPGLADETE